MFQWGKYASRHLLFSSSYLPHLFLTARSGEIQLIHYLLLILVTSMIPFACTDRQVYHPSLQTIRETSGSLPAANHLLPVVLAQHTCSISCHWKELCTLHCWVKPYIIRTSGFRSLRSLMNFCHYWIKQPLLISEMDKSNQVLRGLYWLVQYSENYFLLLWCMFPSISCNANYKICKWDACSHNPHHEDKKIQIFLLFIFCTSLKYGNNFKNDRKQHSKFYHALNYNILCLLPMFIFISKTQSPYL